MTYGQPDPPPPTAPSQSMMGFYADTDPAEDVDAPLQFGGVAEIAAMLGVPRSTVSMWDSRRGTNGYPEPVARLTMGPVYDLEAVRLWHTAKGQQS